jgi:hypothetical protein
MKAASQTSHILIEYLKKLPGKTLLHLRRNILLSNLQHLLIFTPLLGVFLTNSTN